MTDRQTADEICAGIFGPPPSERELAQQIVLSENYGLELQETVERLEQQLNEALEQLKTLKGML